ncbi:MAG: 30S ribosomal protein S8 [Candidatus Nealsonbacteria bacterium]
MTDPISDMLNRIKNAQAAGLQTVIVPFSNLKYEVSNLLEKNGFVDKVEKKGRKTKKEIEITLKYQDGIGAISGLKRISKPGQRMYSDSRKIRRVRDGFGMAILSTSKGLMTNNEAKKKKQGGEIICEVW